MHVYTRIELNLIKFSSIKQVKKRTKKEKKIFILE